MSSIGTVGAKCGGFLFLILFVFGVMPAVTAQAAKPTHQQALAACKAKYGKKVVNAIVNKNGSLTCQWQVYREMTRAEAYESCRKKFGNTTIMMMKKKNGWACRYKPRTSF